MPSAEGSFQSEPVVSDEASATLVNDDAARQERASVTYADSQTVVDLRKDEPAWALDPAPGSHLESPYSPQAENYTQRYLRLLNTGRLASKQKHARTDGGAPLGMSRGRSLASSCEWEPDRGPSVYDTELQRLKAQADAADKVQPVRQLRCSSAGSSRSAASQPSSPSAKAYPAWDGTADGINAILGIPPGLMYRRIYGPGPGSYSPSCGPRGSWEGPGFSFGSGRQRPPNACIQEQAYSPGPVYLPSKDAQDLLSSSLSPARCRFGKHAVGSRTDPNAEMPSNHPHWNPGPGVYQPSTTATGTSTIPGMERPFAPFGSAAKLVSAASNFSATPFITNTHSLKENQGVHSPGPAQYSPAASTIGLAAANAPSFSMSAKAASFFDRYLDPNQQLSPGPVYGTGDLDRRGSRTWGHQQRATFGRGPKAFEPERNMSATVFISKAHSRVNQGVYSPGPVYDPASPLHVRTPLMNSGPLDRFYDRFEPGRIQ